MNYPVYSSQDFITAQQEVMPSLPRTEFVIVWRQQGPEQLLCKSHASFMLHASHLKKEVLVIIKFLKQTTQSA